MKRTTSTYNNSIVHFRPITEFSEEQWGSFSTGVNNVNLIKTALIAVEGTFKDSNSTPHVFTSDRLNKIADFTNKALETGNIIPVCLDHNKSVHTTVGRLGENAAAFTKVIEEQDLPNPKARHLLGKVGLFLSDVVIQTFDAVEKVANKIVTSVSMGLNLDPADHRVMELSLVPIPAIPHMGLFKKGDVGISDDSLNNAFTWEDLEGASQTLEIIKDDYDDLTEKLWTLLNNIYTSEVADISDIDGTKTYVTTALNGFSLRLLDVLGLADNSTVQGADATGGTQDMSSALSADTVANAASTQPNAAMYSRAPKKGLLNFTKYRA